MYRMSYQFFPTSCFSSISTDEFEPAVFIILAFIFLAVASLSPTILSIEYLAPLISKFPVYSIQYWNHIIQSICKFIACSIWLNNTWTSTLLFYYFQKRNISKILFNYAVSNIKGWPTKVFLSLIPHLPEL